MEVHSKNWTDVMEGTSTDWANLPTEMNLGFKATGTQVLVFAHMSRVQHQSASVNTEFRILVNRNDEKNQVSLTNTGNSAEWGYKTVDFVGWTQVKVGDFVHVEVQYKTESGILNWHSNAHGPQERQLTVLNF
jgi:hypothetical protein